MKGSLLTRALLSRVIVTAILIAGVVLFAAPLVWMVSTTLKMDHELVRRPVRWMPDTEVAPAQSPWVDAEGNEHALGLGRVFAVNQQGEQFALTPVDGVVDWGGLADAEDESNPALRRWDYNVDIATWGSVNETFVLDLPPSEVAHWIIETANDRSFHRLGIEVENADGTWATAPHVIAKDEHQDLICRTSESPQVFRWDRILSQTSEDSRVQRDRVHVRATLDFSSHTRGVWYKFTEQYRRALIYLDFWGFTANSIYLVFLCCIGAVIASSLVAFGFARLKWHGRNVLFLILLATMMLPPQVTMVPQFLIWRGLGAYDTLVPLWLPTFFGVPFFIFLLRQFMMTLPKDLEDAARIDGCSTFGIWWRVVMPLIKPALIAVAIFQFLATWNEFMMPLIYVANPAKQPLSVGVYIFNMAFTGQWGLILAAATMMLLPVLAMFFFAQRYFIEGVTLTGLKA